ncbi:MAG: DUF1800 domain-containing protein [Acidimicrobiales bacterium]
MDVDPNRSALAHLYRRAGFGARPDELDAAVAAGWGSTVAHLLDMNRPDPNADAVALPQLPPLSPGKPPQAGAIDDQLVAWWLDRMIVTANPLREKLALFWHGHFATSVQKVKEPELMYRQNQIFRSAGAGRFGDLALTVAKDPAMLIWLDANSDRKASPNENLARELMELFVLGIGHYSEDDVKNAARAFTGWQVDRQSGNFRLAANQHDTGPKTFLGQTGNFSGEDIVRIATSRPETARFVAQKVFSHFARPVSFDDGIVSDLSSAFAKDLDVSKLMAGVFAHPEFTSTATRTGLVKQPVEYVAGALRALGLRARDVPALAQLLAGLGQVPFAPPNVGGWPQNTYWLNTSTALARLRFAQAVTARAALTPLSSVSAPARPEAAVRLLSVDGWSPSTTDALSSVADDPKALLTVALVSPEYVLA